MKHVLITVGSTFFDELVDAALSVEVLAAFRARSVEEVVVQCGAYKGKRMELSTLPLREDRNGLRLEIYSFKPSLAEDFAKAELVISHAGSGTIIDVLRLGKPLIVIPNPSLLDNHQQDLAIELEKLGYLKAATPRTLQKCIETFNAEGLKPFPPKDKGKFQAVMDEMMGFA